MSTIKNQWAAQLKTGCHVSFISLNQHCNLYYNRSHKEGLECYGASEKKKKKTCPETIMYLQTSTVQGESEGFHWFQVELKQVKPQHSSSLYHNVIIIINIDHLQATFKYNL